MGGAFPGRWNILSATALAVAEARAVNPHDAPPKIRKVSEKNSSRPVATIGTMPAGATKAQRQAFHKLKMDMKKRRRGA